MNEMAERVQARDADRLRVLQAVYEMVNANTHAYVPMAAVYEKAGIDQQRGRDASNYLEAERLLMGKPGHHLSITHSGVNEAEHSLRAPTERTAHFSSVVVNQVFNGAVGAVQTGANANANVQQNIAAPADPHVATLIAELRIALANVADEDERKAAEEVVDGVVKEATKPKPNPLRLKGYLTTLATIQALATPASQLVQHFFP